MRLLATGLLLAALPTTAEAANRHSRRMIAAGESQQQALFTTLLQRSSEKCSRVTKVMFQGDAGGEDHWNVACADGGSYLISIKDNPNGDSRIIDCKMLAAVTGRAGCWVKY